MDSRTSVKSNGESNAIWDPLQGAGSQPAPSPSDATGWDRWCRGQVLQRLAALRGGCLEIEDGLGQCLLGGVATEVGEQPAKLVIHHPRVYRDFLLGGSIGAAEAYMAGEWSSPDLPALIRLLVRNLDLINALDDGLAQLGKPLLKALHGLHRNSLKGSRRNIAAHYDLGNELFECFLDPTMMYSAAIFPHPDASLEAAQTYKLDRICRKLALAPEDHLLEIGSGWGALAVHAATHWGCRVTTTTLSQHQYDKTRERVAAAGLENRVIVRLQDYRELRGRYDKLVSIEMIEAVGHRYYGDYFQQCGALLKPDGLALIQAITLPEQRYERARRNVDFIQRYIFPGSCIPSIGAMLQAAGNASDLNLVHLEDFSAHYATTLAQWRRNFLDQRSRIIDLGFDETFVRLWDFYFAYCEGGFAERGIGVAQLVFAKPGNRRDAILGRID